MTVQERLYTPAEFEAFVKRPENADKLFELIAGEIIEVPSNPYVSFIGSIILTALMNFVLANKLGFVTGEAGGYMVGDERYAPDVAYISFEKQPALARSGYNPNPPDLAVEVLSTDTTAQANQMRVKVSNYLAAGTVVWVVDPDAKTVEVHAPGMAVIVYRGNATVDGAPVLPGLTLDLAWIFQRS
jgi:Uma2 family endonuclease